MPILLIFTSAWWRSLHSGHAQTGYLRSWMVKTDGRGPASGTLPVKDDALRVAACLKSEYLNSQHDESDSQNEVP